MIPDEYKWLLKEGAPQILVQALRLYGVKEIVGNQHNPTVLAWAEEIGGWVKDFYKADEIPWCGLFIGIVAKRAGYPFSQKMLSAKAWLEWGHKANIPMLGDVLVFSREGGGHVALYVGEDNLTYHVLGGNQNNSVNITRIAKSRFVGARRCPWRIGQPKNVRRVFLSSKGKLSTNEA